MDHQECKAGCQRKQVTTMKCTNNCKEKKIYIYMLLQGDANVKDDNRLTSLHAGNGTKIGERYTNFEW